MQITTATTKTTTILRRKTNCEKTTTIKQEDQKIQILFIHMSYSGSKTLFMEIIL